MWVSIWLWAMINCLSCCHLNLRKVTRLQAQHEHGYCDAKDHHIVFIRMERQCDSFQGAEADLVHKRDEWLKKIK